MSDPYMGEIRMVAFDFAPYGWALCHGQRVPVMQNQALFVLLGTRYGGNDEKFALPDFSGRFPMGTSSADPKDASPNSKGLRYAKLGDVGGSETSSLGPANVPAHSHDIDPSKLSVTVPISIPVTTSTVNGTATPSTDTVLGPLPASQHSTLYSTSASDTTLKTFKATGTISGATTASAGAGAANGNGVPIDIRNPYLTVNFIIALTGIFPTRS